MSCRVVVGPGVYLSVLMAETSLSIILTVWVLRLYHTGPQQTKMSPRCVATESLLVHSNHLYTTTTPRHRPSTDRDVATLPRPLASRGVRPLRAFQFILSLCILRLHQATGLQQTETSPPPLASGGVKPLRAF